MKACGNAQRIDVDYRLSVVAVNHSCMFNLAAIPAELSNGAEYISFLRGLRRSGRDCTVSLLSRGPIVVMHWQDYVVAGRLIDTA